MNEAIDFYTSIATIACTLIYKYSVELVYITFDNNKFMYINVLKNKNNLIILIIFYQIIAR
jgi:hypothetical protein